MPSPLIRTRLIWIHIEKTAGNSFRVLAYDNYGRENVVWSGIDLRKPNIEHTDVVPYTVVGGHWPYNDYINHNAEYVYCSVLREPVARMKSFFNFICTKMDNAGKQQWSTWGFDPESLSNTLRKSAKFVRMIESRQCWMLSGQHDCDSAIKVLENNNFIVGTLDQHKVYIKTLEELFGWRKSEFQHVNKGAMHYQDSIKIDDALMPLVEEICQQDRLLFERVNQQGVLNSTPRAVAKTLYPNALPKTLSH